MQHWCSFFLHNAPADSKFFFTDKLHALTDKHCKNTIAKRSTFGTFNILLNYKLYLNSRLMYSPYSAFVALQIRRINRIKERTWMYVQLAYISG